MSKRVPEPVLVRLPLVEAEVPEMVSWVPDVLTLIALVVEAVRFLLKHFQFRQVVLFQSQ